MLFEVEGFHTEDLVSGTCSFMSPLREGSGKVGGRFWEVWDGVGPAAWEDLNVARGWGGGDVAGADLLAVGRSGGGA